MKKWIYSMLIVLCGMMVTMTFTACGGDDGDDGSNGSGLTGWYYEGTPPYKDNFFERASDYVVFYDDGRWWPRHVWLPSCYEDEKNGYIHMVMEYTGEDGYDFIHILDGNSLMYYTGVPYQYGASGTAGLDCLYKLNTDSYGIIGYYGGGTYYVYTREGNNIVITQGNEKVIFTITSDGLLQSGGGKWTKYNPSTVY